MSIFYKQMLTMMLFFMVSTANAQHFSFQGVSMGIPVQPFVQKLQEKGWTKDNVRTQKSGEGEIVMQGKYRGYPAHANVFYSEKSKVVYNVAILIHSKDDEYIMPIYHEFKEKFPKEYNDYEYSDSFDYDWGSWNYCWENNVVQIDMTLVCNFENYPKEFVIYINHWDNSNYKLFDNE